MSGPSLPRCAIALALCLALPCLAKAEGRCPPGQFPVGGQGMEGCAPIPGGGGDSGPAAPVPTGEWEMRWGAIAEISVPMSVVFL